MLKKNKNSEIKNKEEINQNFIFPKSNTNIKIHEIKFLPIILILFIFFNYLVSILPIEEYSDPFIFSSNQINILVQTLGSIFIKNLLLGTLIFGLYPKILGFHYNRQNYFIFFERIGMDWLKSIFRYIILSFAIFSLIILVFLTLYLGFIVPYFSSFSDIFMPNFYFTLTMLDLTWFIGFSIWQEIVLRGIILTILLHHFNKWTAITYSSFIHLSFYITMIFLTYPYYLVINFQIFFVFPIILLYSLINSYLFYKTHSLISGIIFNSAILSVSILLPYIIYPWLV